MRRATDHRHRANRERGTPFWVTPRAARVVLIALHVVAGVAVLAELLFPLADGGHAVERVHSLDFPASYAIYGFLACVMLVLLGIGLRRLVMRSEDYYQDGGR